MAIPEPEFTITAYQLAAILEEKSFDWEQYHSSKARFIHDCRAICYDHLDTI